METSQIIVFQDKEIRRIFHNDEWYFSIVDVVEFLTDSTDAKQYVKRMRARDPLLNSKWGTICTPVEMTAKDGRHRKVQAATVKGLFRIIQSISSPKAEPFKQWLAQVGYERVQEIEKVDRQTPAGYSHPAEPHRRMAGTRHHGATRLRHPHGGDFKGDIRRNAFGIPIYKRADEEKSEPPRSHGRFRIDLYHARRACHDGNIATGKARYVPEKQDSCPTRRSRRRYRPRRNRKGNRS